MINTVSETQFETQHTYTTWKRTAIYNKWRRVHICFLIS